MKYVPERELIDTFRRRLVDEDLEDIHIIYKVTGGMPSEALHEELEVGGDGTMRVHIEDRLRKVRSISFCPAPNQRAALEWIQSMGSLLGNTAPLKEMFFEPHELVGCLLVQVGNEQAELYFRPEEDGDLMPHECVPCGSVESVLSYVSQVLERPIQRSRHVEDN